MIAAAPPDDGQEWECQCARCGSSAERVTCEDCGGERVVTDEDEDGAEVEVRCDSCDGAGGWWACLSTLAWCEEHPLPGRADVERGAVEWFVVGPSQVEAPHG